MTDIPTDRPLAQGVEVSGPAGQNLVDVGLMPGVKDDRVVRRLENPMQCQTQLDHTQVGAKMPTGRGDLMDQELADLVSEQVQFSLRETLQVTRPLMSSSIWPVYAAI